jgi:hypothetical protein
MASLLLQRSRPDDAELIRRIAAGDGAAFGELDDGTAIGGTKAIVAWAKANPA